MRHSTTRFRMFLTACLSGILAISIAPAQSQEVRVGIIASISNPSASVNSTNLIAGIRMYFEHVNRQGGVNGRRMVLVHRDDNVEAKRMVDLTEELLADPSIIAFSSFLNTAGIAELNRQETLLKQPIALVAPIGGGPRGMRNAFPLRGNYFDEVDALIEEMKTTYKKRLALVYVTQAFGPATFKYAEGAANKADLAIVATAQFSAQQGDMVGQAGIAAETIAKATPDAVLIIAAGGAASEFVKAFRATASGSAQLFALSALDAATLVRIAGLDNARGVIITQALPFPQDGTRRVVREYLSLMKTHAPGQPVSYLTLEGFMGAKILVEAVRRAGPNPTREKVLVSLRSLVNFDLGDYEVNYAVDQLRRTPFMEMTIVGSSGKIFR